MSATRPAPARQNHVIVSGYPGVPLLIPLASLADDQGGRLRLRRFQGPPNSSIVDPGAFDWVPDVSDLGTTTARIEWVEEDGTLVETTLHLFVLTSSIQLTLLGTIPSSAHPLTSVSIPLQVTNAARQPSFSVSTSQTPSSQPQVSQQPSLTFQWMPQWADIFRMFSFTITATDGMSSDAQTINIFVNDQPPKLNPIPPQTFKVGTPVSFDLSSFASDPDNDQLGFSGSGLPDGLQLTGRSLTGTPSRAATFNATIKVTDPGNLSDQKSWTITVNSPWLTGPGFDETDESDEV